MLGAPELRRPEPIDNIPSTPYIVPLVPAIDRLSTGFDGAMRQDGVVYPAPNDAQRGGRFQGARIFFTVKRNNSEALTDAADKEHCLVAADAVLPGHASERGVDLRQAV